MIDVVANVAALEAGATRIETLEILFQIGMTAAPLGSVKPRVSMAGEGFALKSPNRRGRPRNVP